MHINLPPEMEKFLQSKVDSGFYTNATEVVRDAIRQMFEEDQKVSALRAALKTGDDQLDKGERRTYTPELLEQITTTAKTNVRRGKKVNPDVVP